MHQTYGLDLREGEVIIKVSVYSSVNEYRLCRIWFMMIDTPPGQAVKKRGAGWDGIKSGGQEEEEAD